MDAAVASEHASVLIHDIASLRRLDWGSRQQRKRAEFTHDTFSFLVVGAALVGLWMVLGQGWFWPALVLVPWGVVLALHGYDTFVNHRLERLEEQRRIGS